MTRIAKLVALLLAAILASPSGASPKGVDKCEDDCWKKLKANLKDCRDDFSDVNDPLRKACGDGAVAGYERCLGRCSGDTRVLVASNLAFVASTEAPRRRAFLVDGVLVGGTHYLTLLNGDGEGGGVGHVKVLLDRRVVYENAAFRDVAAAEIPVDLESGAYALVVQSEDHSEGTVTVFLSDAPLADRADLPR